MYNISYYFNDLYPFLLITANVTYMIHIFSQLPVEKHIFENWGVMFEKYSFIFCGLYGGYLFAILCVDNRCGIFNIRLGLRLILFIGVFARGFRCFLRLVRVLCGMGWDEKGLEVVDGFQDLREGGRLADAWIFTWRCFRCDGVYMEL